MDKARRKSTHRRLNSKRGMRPSDISHRTNKTRPITKEISRSFFGSMYFVLCFNGLGLKLLPLLYFRQLPI